MPPPSSWGGVTLIQAACACSRLRSGGRGSTAPPACIDGGGDEPGLTWIATPCSVDPRFVGDALEKLLSSPTPFPPTRPASSSTPYALPAACHRHWPPGKAPHHHPLGIDRDALGGHHHHTQLRLRQMGLSVPGAGFSCSKREWTNFTGPKRACPTPSAWLQGGPTRFGAGKTALSLVAPPLRCFDDAAGHSLATGSPGWQPHHHHRAAGCWLNRSARPQPGLSRRHQPDPQASSGPIQLRPRSRASGPDSCGLRAKPGPPSCSHHGRSGSAHFRLRPCAGRPAAWGGGPPPLRSPWPSGEWKPTSRRLLWRSRPCSWILCLLPSPLVPCRRRLNLPGMDVGGC